MMHARILLLALIISQLALILSPLVTAGSPWFMQQIEAKVTFSGDTELTATGGSYSVDWLRGNFYVVPQESSTQHAELLSVTPETYSIKADDFGNSYMEFRWPQPDHGKFNYLAVWHVNVSQFRYALTSAGELDAEIPKDAAVYLTVDNLTSWSGFMKAKAESLVNGSDSVLESARRIASWVSFYLTYDMACWASSLPAETVFIEQRGVCDEFTNLFVSMCRSIGIPARYVEGVVFSGEDWNFHAWAEVYAGKWVPIDATYNEIGFVDSSHIALARVHGDDDVYNTLNWQGSKINVEFGEEELAVDLLKSEPYPLLSLDIDAPDELAGSQIANLTAHISNLANSIIAPTCALNMPPDMKILDDKEKSLIISPHGTADITWTLASPPGLDTQWLHKMPVQVSCFGGPNMTVTITVDPRTETPLVARATITDLTVINSSLVSVSFRNDGTKTLEGLTVSLCVNDNETCFDKAASPLGSGEQDKMAFTEVAVGENDVVWAELSSDELNTVSDGSTVPAGEIPEVQPQPAPQKPPTGAANFLGNDSLILLVSAVVAALVTSLIIVRLRRRRPF